MRLITLVVCISIFTILGACPTTTNTSLNSAPIGGNTQSPPAKFCASIGEIYKVKTASDGSQSGECTNRWGYVLYTDAEYYKYATVFAACQAADGKVAIASGYACSSNILDPLREGGGNTLMCDCGNANTCYNNGVCSPIPSNNACTIGNGTVAQEMACKASEDFSTNNCANPSNTCSLSNSTYRWTCDCGTNTTGNTQCWNGTKCGAETGSCESSADACGNGSTDTVPTCHVNGTSGSTLNGVTCA